MAASAFCLAGAGCAASDGGDLADDFEPDAFAPVDFDFAVSVMEILPSMSVAGRGFYRVAAVRRLKRGLNLRLMKAYAYCA